jgi:glycosyltransferase involved in cell wall biosynthesis
MALVRADCADHGIDWLPQRFRSRPRIAAPALRIMHMMWLMHREVSRHGVCLLHARSYVPALAALVVGGVARVPFLFDMRALWPEELITASRLRRGSILHRLVVAMERWCLARAAGVISLTRAAVEYLHEMYPEELRGKRLAVIPTCVDLERFTPGKAVREGPRIYSCIGTILSGWFRTDWLAAWLTAVANHDPQARFDIVTRDNACHVRSALDPQGLLDGRLSVEACTMQDMPERVQTHDVSAMFFFGGLGKLGSSPTRLAEMLACGLPVVTNSGVGDVARIIKKHRVGVLVDGPGSDQLASALCSLDTLLNDPELPVRCRNAAEQEFSLEVGVRAYAELYAAVLDDSGRAAACAG